MRIEDVRIVCAFARQPEEKSLFSTLYSIIPIHIMFRIQMVNLHHSTHRFGKGALCTSSTAQGLKRHVGL